jgi:hypothetical protein
MKERVHSKYEVIMRVALDVDMGAAVEAEECPLLEAVA